MDYGHGRNDITPSTCAAERPEYGGGDWHGRLVHLDPEPRPVRHAHGAVPAERERGGGELRLARAVEGRELREGQRGRVEELGLARLVEVVEVGRARLRRALGRQVALCLEPAVSPAARVRRLPHAMMEKRGDAARPPPRIRGTPCLNLLLASDVKAKTSPLH